MSDGFFGAESVQFCTPEKSGFLKIFNRLKIDRFFFLSFIALKMILTCSLMCVVPELKSSVIVFLCALRYFNLAIAFEPFILK